MSIANSIRAQIPPIHPEGYPFIGILAAASLALFWIWTPLGWIGTLLTVWCALFFRDPVRVTPVRDGIVVSPADGRVLITGGFGVLFWLGVVGLGLLFPLALPFLRSSAFARRPLLGASCVLVGGLLLRFVVIMAPYSKLCSKSCRA